MRTARKPSKSPPIRRLALLLGLPLLVACGADEQDNASPAPQDEQAAYNSDLNMQDFMNFVLEPTADQLWEAAGWVLDEDGYHDLYPTDEEGWDHVRNQAAVLIETGNMLALPHRAEDREAWIAYSQGLSAAGAAALEAAEARNEEDFFQAGARIYSVCTACHQAYSPDISRFTSE